MPRMRPTFAEMLGLKSISGRDVTGNRENPPAAVPLRRNAEIARRNTLDDLSEPQMFGGQEFESDCDPEDDEALIDVHETAAFVNSQLDPTEECPSTLDPNRFTFQNEGED